MGGKTEKKKTKKIQLFDDLQCNSRRKLRKDWPKTEEDEV